MTLRDKLTLEIESNENQIEPNVTIWVDDNCSIFWETKDGEYVFLASDSNYSNYKDDSHQEIELDTAPEGVSEKGVRWNNLDFETPFHISDFMNRINTITI